MIDALGIVAALFAFVAPPVAVAARARLRVIGGLAVAPALIVALAAVISAPTGWGRHGGGDEGFSNSTNLVLLAVFVAVAGTVGLVVAAVTAATRRLRSCSVRGGLALERPQSPPVDPA